MKAFQKLLLALLLAATTVVANGDGPSPGNGSFPGNGPFPGDSPVGFPINFTENGLSFGFYKNSCSNAETLVRQTVQNALNIDLRNGASFVRMFFHDAFVEGADGSILIDSTANNTAEKEGRPNLTVRGFEFIDQAKASIEAVCPRTVSCADIIALAARDSVDILGGPFFPIRTGRRDGRVSLANNTGALPSPLSNLSVLTTAFANKGLSQSQMVDLSGFHTIGKASCPTFTNRLYNFSSNASVDPTLDSAYALQLQAACPFDNITGIVNMDPQTPTVVDKLYYDNLLAKKGLFTSDVALLTSSQTLTQVTNNAQNPGQWLQNVIPALFVMGEIDVKTGSNGEIRLNCSVINP